MDVLTWMTLRQPSGSFRSLVLTWTNMVLPHQHVGTILEGLDSLPDFGARTPPPPKRGLPNLHAHNLSSTRFLGSFWGN